MMRALFTALALLVAIALGVLLVVRARPSEPAAAPRVERSAAPEQTPDAPLVEPRDDVPAPSEAAAAAPDERRTAVPAPPEPETADVAPAGRLLVVVDETGARVPHAQVAWLQQHDASQQDLALAFRESGGDIGAVLARFGRTGTADERGELVLDGITGSVVVTGSKGDRAGMLEARDGAGELLLELRPTLALRARVVDAHGAPQVDVPVALRFHHGASYRDHVLARTGPDGIATFGAVDELLARAPASARPSLGLPFPLAEPVHAPFDPAALPNEPIELVMPPTGELEVLVVDAAGEPRVDPVVVRVLDEAAAFRGENSEPALGTMLLVRDDRGRALFGHVGLGLDLLVYAFDQTVLASGGEPKAVHERVAGPVAAGERASVRLRLEREPAALEGVLLLPGGEPAASARVVALLRDVNGGYFLETTIDTDAAGRVRIAVAQSGRDVEALELRLVGSSDDLRAHVSLADVPGAGVRDLGALRLAPAPLLVAGRVVNAEGEPLSGARAYVVGVMDVGASTGDDGRFAIRGFAPTSELRVATRRAGYVSGEPRPVAPGARDVELVLVLGGVLQGRVLAGEGVPADALLVRLDGEAGVRIADLDEAGAFRVEGLPAGSVDVLVFLRQGEEPLARVDDVAVELGERSADPRLDPIDLGAIVRRLSIRVLNAEQEPIFDATVWLGATRVFVDERGTWPVLTTNPAVDLRVTAPGHRPLELRNVAADRTVLLEPGIPVRLFVAGMPAPPLGVRAVLERADDPDAGTEVALVGADGEAELLLPARGTYRVFLVLTDERDDAVRSVELRPGGASDFGTIDVEDAQAEQRFDLALSPEIIEDALERLR